MYRHQNLTPSPKGVMSRSRCIGIRIKTSATHHQSALLVVGSKDIFVGNNSFLPLIKSKTEQRNHHWHLVNVTLYHLFRTHNQTWLKSNKRKKKSPSQSESMHRDVSELCLMGALIYTRQQFTSTLFSYLHSNNLALLPPLSICLSNYTGRTKRKSTNLLHRSLTMKVVATRRKLRK